MSGSQRIAVRYFVPHDGDSEEHPNVFFMANPRRKLQLRDVASSFPLPGTYHFRFKASYGKSSVWVDVNDMEDPVPVFNGTIVAKVTRLSFAPSQVQAPAPAAAARTAAPAPARQSAQAAAQAAPNGRSPKPVASSPGHRPRAPSDGGDLLGLAHKGAATPGKAAGAPAAAADDDEDFGLFAGAEESGDGGGGGSGAVEAQGDLDWSHGDAFAPSAAATPAPGAAVPAPMAATIAPMGSGPMRAPPMATGTGWQQQQQQAAAQQQGRPSRKASGNLLTSGNVLDQFKQ